MSEAGADPQGLSQLRHELRTPLNAIIGYSEMLLEELDVIGPPRFQARLQSVRGLGKQLLARINELVQPSRVGPTPEALTQLLDELRAQLSGPASEVLTECEHLLHEAEEGGAQPALKDDLGKIDAAGRKLFALLDEPLARAPELERRPVETGRLHIISPHAGERVVSGHILVVDDREANRELLARRLERQGYTVSTASGGHEALTRMAEVRFDLVLLDILMPDLDGMEVLRRMKSTEGLRDIPVIIISALDELESVVPCIEMGAEDYLSKPFNPVLLRARIVACLEKKRLRDQEQAYLQQLRVEQEKSERLLLNVLPAPIAERLKAGEETIADTFPDVTVLFSDLCDFTDLSARVKPTELVQLLNEIFSTFDELAARHGLEKIKTIGDSYMVVGGLPTPRVDHAEAICRMAIEMQREMARIRDLDGKSPRLRIGVHSGSVVAGVIGTRKFAFDLWGDTVNTASRMESYGLPGEIHVSDSTYQRLRDRFRFRNRRELDVKGKGPMVTWCLDAERTLRIAEGGEE